MVANNAGHCKHTSFGWHGKVWNSNIAKYNDVTSATRTYHAAVTITIQPLFHLPRLIL
jgi:hypothetical protein